MSCFRANHDPDPAFGAPLLDITLNDVPCSLFLDTGSSISIVTLATLRYLGLNPRVHPSAMVVQGVSGALVPIGVAPIRMVIGESTFTHPFVVVPGPSQLPGTLLIGHDVLSTFNIWLHPHSNSVWMDGAIRPLRRHSDKWGPKALPPPSPSDHTALCHEQRLSDSQNEDLGSPSGQVTDSALHPTLVTHHHSPPSSSGPPAGTTMDHELLPHSPTTGTQRNMPPTPAPRTLTPQPPVVPNAMPRLPHQEPLVAGNRCPANNLVNNQANTSALPTTTDQYVEMPTAASRSFSNQLTQKGPPLTTLLPHPPRPPNATARPPSPSACTRSTPAADLSHHLTWHNGKSDHVSAFSSIVIPGYSSRWVKAVANVANHAIAGLQGHILVDPLQATHKRLFIPPGLYQIRDGGTEVVVVNKTPNAL